MTIYPHPKRDYQGYDPGNPVHVAALHLVRPARKGKGKYYAVWGDDFIAASGTKTEVLRYMMVVAPRTAYECQADRKREHQARAERVAVYLAVRAKRDANQLSLF